MIENVSDISDIYMAGVRTGVIITILFILMVTALLYGLYHHTKQKDMQWRIVSINGIKLFYECPKCKARVPYDYYTNSKYELRYCLHCGAKLAIKLKREK